MAILTRTPVIALDYSEKDKAIKKELMIDYDTGNIYVVSATDKNIIFNITEKLINQIHDLSGENITVIIEGIGVVNLTEFLNQLKVKLDKSVQFKDPGIDFAYIIQDATIDEKSLKVFNGKVQIDNYTSADKLAIPQKTDSGIRWMPISELIDKLGTPTTDSGYSEIDGNLKKVPLITNQNNKIYLNSHACKSYNLTGNFANVYLSSTVDEYSIVKWEITQIESQFKMIFEAGVVYCDTMRELPVTIGMNETSNLEISIDQLPDTHYKFVFETFDYGATWNLTINRYRSKMTEYVH